MPTTITLKANYPKDKTIVVNDINGRRVVMAEGDLVVLDSSEARSLLAKFPDVVEKVGVVKTVKKEEKEEIELNPRDVSSTE